MEGKIKHLEFVQGVVNRLSTNSFLLKGWTVVLVSALFALSAKDANARFVLLAYVPALAFWALDAYFLALERNYRILYDQVRSLDVKEIDFSMNVQVDNGVLDWGLAFFSKTLLVFRGAIMLAVTVVLVIQMNV